MSREWRFYIDDMIEFSSYVLEYTEGYTQESFLDDRRTFDATMRNMELIGEAATHIPAEVREKYPSIPWRQIIAMRDQIIHAYLGLDNDILWSVIDNDIPELVQNLKTVR